MAFLNGFTPATSDRFTVLTSANITGTFANAPNGGRVSTGNGGQIQVSYTDDATDTVELKNFIQTHTQVLAQVGDPSPDGNGTLTNIDVPVLNDSGHVAFYSEISGGEDENGFIRIGVTANPELVARTGQAAPGTGQTIADLEDGNIALNATGRVVFQANLSDTFSGNEAILFDDTHSFFTVAQTGQAVPGGNGQFGSDGQTFDGGHSINTVGSAAFIANLVGTSGGGSDERGVFRFDDGALTEVARTGQTAPGGGQYGYIDRVVLNDAGQLAFESELTGIGGTDPSGVYREDGGTITELIRTGAASPDGNGTISSVVFPAFNDAGQAALKVLLTGTTGGSDDDSALLVTDGVTTSLVAREGQAAPDGDGTFVNINPPKGLNNAGQIVFSANLQVGPSGFGVFRGDGTDLTQIFRSGQAAPDGNGTFRSLDSAALNDAGQVAFDAILFGAEDRGIFLFDDAMGLIQVARKGDTFLGSTITDLDFKEGTNSKGNETSGFNELGQIAYTYALADGRRGVALWSFETLAAMILGDYNGSGQVEQGDLDLVLQNWGLDTVASGVPAGWTHDLPDGLIDQGELDGVLLNWGSTTAPSFAGSAVPEPGTAALLAAGLALLGSRRGPRAQASRRQAA